MKYYNRTNTCDICEINFDIATGNPCTEKDNKGNWTGKWLCHNCWSKHERKNNPNCTDNVKKSLRDHRTGNLNPNSNQTKGDNFEELTSRWKGVKILSKENDNYCGPLDHSRDSELGIIQTQGKLYDSRNRYWVFGSLYREWNKEFDYEICYCVSKDGKIIERIYIIPKEEIIKRSSMAIVKNPNTCPTWYEKYRITDEEIVKKVNDIWREIIKEME